MPKLIPVDHDPFAPAAPKAPRLIPVDHDPFAGVDAQPTPFEANAQEQPGMWSGEAIKNSLRPYVEAGRGLVAGSAQLGETAGAGLQYLGGRLGSEMLSRAGESVAKRFEQESQAFAAPQELQGSVWDNPKLLANASWWAYSTAQMAPSLAAAMLPGAAAGKAIQVGGKAIQLSPQVIARLAHLGQAAGAGAAGGAMEGAGTYREVLNQGGSETEAARAAEIMGAGSAALNAISFGKMLGKAGGSAAARVGKHLVAGATEGITEGAEEPWEEYSKGIAHYLETGEFDPQTWGNMVQAIKERSLNVAGPAALTGAGGSVLSGGEAQVEQKRTPPTPEPTPTPAAPNQEAPLPLTDIREVGGERQGVVDTRAQQPSPKLVPVEFDPWETGGMAPPFDIGQERYLGGQVQPAPEESLPRFVPLTTEQLDAQRKAELRQGVEQDTARMVNDIRTQRMAGEVQDQMRFPEAKGVAQSKNQANLNLGQSNIVSDQTSAAAPLAQRAEEARRPALDRTAKINGITLEEAGRMMAEGDPGVVEHVKAAVQEHGPMQAQDAIRNEALRQMAEAPRGEARERVRQNIAQVEPAVNGALAEQPVIKENLITEPIPVETDPARIQEIRNSIAEGEMILKSGRNTIGHKMSPEQINAVRRGVENARAKIGEEMPQARVSPAPAMEDQGKGGKVEQGASGEVGGGKDSSRGWTKPVPRKPASPDKFFSYMSAFEDTPEGYRESSGKRIIIPGHEYLDLFVTKDEGYWTVSEGKSGLALSHPSKTRREAIGEARDGLDGEGKSRILQLISAHIKEKGLSPRYSGVILGAENQPRASRTPTPTTGLPVAEVEKAIRPLEEWGKHAAPTIAVQSVADMTPSAQAAYRREAQRGSGRIRAYYHEGITYLIANEIVDQKDAWEGWMHEQIGHHGIRSIFPVDSQWQNVMQATYNGMPEADIKRIRELYGIQGQTNREHHLIADEYIASLAEKVDLKEAMTRKEMSLWQRFVAAVRRAWRKVFGNRRFPTFTSEQLAAIIHDATRAVMTGEMTGQAHAVYGRTFGEPVVGLTAGLEDEGRAQRVQPRDEGGRFSIKDTRGPVTFTSEESESRYTQAKKGIADQRSLVRRFNAAVRHLFTRFRYLPDLPKTAQFAEARETIRQFEAAPTAAKEQAVRALDQIAGKLSPQDYDLFTRKVILDDLSFEAGREHALPFGFTPETVAQDKARVDARVRETPVVREALDRRKRLLDSIKKALLDSGVMSEEQFNNPAYFRHQVITYAAERQYAQGAKRIRRPRPGYAMKREGSIEDINANYLEAEFEYLHRALIDIKAAETIDRLSAKYDKRAEAKAQAEKWNKAHPEEKRRTWKDFLPEGHTLWSPETGNVFFTARPQAERIMRQFMDRVREEGGIPGVSADEVAAVLEKIGEAEAKSGRLMALVIPNELATTLDAMKKQNTLGWLDQAFRVPLGMWKRWVLINPRRVLKYNLNNLSGDLDAVIAGNPKAIKKLPEAIRELYAVMRGGKPSVRYREALARGVFDTGLTVQEIPEINKLDRFTRLRADLTAKDMPVEAARRAWRFLKDYTQFRENWLRYAAYLDYVERLESGESMKSIGYGATYAPLVDGLSDAKDKAGLLARDLVGDYGAVSEAGKELRAKLIPFYSWLEVNTRRYLRIFANAYGQGIGQGLKTTGTVGAIKGSRLSAWLGVRIALMYGLVQAWNNLFFPDEEDELDAQARTQLHLTLGRDKDGKVQTLRFQGALSDFLAWIGFEDAVGVVREMQKGRADLGDLLTTVAKAPVNKIVGGVTPLIRTPVELAAKRSFWPDVFRPRVIPDRGREFTRLFSLENEYDWLTDAPTRGYWKSVKSALVYERDTGETAYNNIQGMKHDYMRKVLGREGSGDYTSPRSEALRNLRKALRYGDESAEKKARAKLRGLGVKPKDIRRSILTQRPLYGLNAADRAKFKRTLTADELQQLEQAEKWYREVFLGRVRQ